MAKTNHLYPAQASILLNGATFVCNVCNHNAEKTSNCKLRVYKMGKKKRESLIRR